MLNVHRARPTVSAEALILLTAGFVVCFDNIAFWRVVLDDRSWHAASTWSYAFGVLLVLIAVYYLILSLLATRALLKPVLIFVLLAGSVVTYYISQYNVVFDSSMVRNVLHTDAHEAAELLSTGLLWTVLLLGVVPSVAVILVNVRRRSWRRAVSLWVITSAAALVIAVGALLTVFQDVAPMVRNHREVRYLVTPLNLFVAAARAMRFDIGAAVASADPLVTVTRAPAASNARPTLFVLVVGETARAANFSLNGYARDTNPGLSQVDIINFSHTRSCGTSTEVSLPCMFSPFGRRAYDQSRIAQHESLVQQVARAGIRVVWRDNQSGCKGVCTGVEVQSFERVELPRVCDGGRCHDEVLLHDLDKLTLNAPRDTMLVLHQIGNHGPAYYRRYPPAFKHFTPACETDALHTCTQQQIVNAYDNALRYTDHVLVKLIEFLQTQRSTYDVALIYVSDHGESLGENGLYLHGMPYAIAPREQLEVPMIWWLSPEFARNRSIDVECLRARASSETSHDHLFHSISGVFDLTSADRDPRWDLFASCRHDLARQGLAATR